MKFKVGSKRKVSYKRYARSNNKTKWISFAFTISTAATSQNDAAKFQALAANHIDNYAQWPSSCAFTLTPTYINAKLQQMLGVTDLLSISKVKIQATTRDNNPIMTAYQEVNGGRHIVRVDFGTSSFTHAFYKTPGGSYTTFNECTLGAGGLCHVKVSMQYEIKLINAL